MEVSTAPSAPATEAAPFVFCGDPALREPVLAALREVIDPEVALSIVELGLVYGVTLGDGIAHVRLTMTSAGCPLSETILADIHLELERVLPGGYEIEIELCWEPAWTPARMSKRARMVMGW
jgi:metal-sulfur cluster biosynthetic enzyme